MEEKIELLSPSEYKDYKSKLNIVENITSKIKFLLSDTINNYLKIGFLLNSVSEEVLISLGCNSIYDYAKENFNIGKTTTKNFINIYKRFGSKLDNDYSTYYQVRLQEEYQNYSMTQLVELLPVPDEEIENYSPELSVNEIRALKKISQLTDFEKEFIEFTKKSFNKLWSMVQKDSLMHVSDFNEFKDNYIDDKVYFSQGNYTFNITYRNYKLMVSVKIDSNYTSYQVLLNCSYISYDLTKYQNFYSKTNINVLSTDNDIESYCSEIVSWIDQIKSVIDTYLEKKESINNNDDNKFEGFIDFVLENKTFVFLDKLPDLFEEVFELKNLNYYYRSLLKTIKAISLLPSKISHSLFTNIFKIEYIHNSQIHLSTEICDDLYFCIDGADDFSFLYKYHNQIGDTDEEYLEFNEIIFKFPNLLKDYGIKITQNNASLFEIFKQCAILWSKDKKKEFDKEYLSNESSASDDEYEEETDDYEDDNFLD